MDVRRMHQAGSYAALARRYAQAVVAGGILTWECLQSIYMLEWAMNTVIRKWGIDLAPGIRIP